MGTRVIIRGIGLVFGLGFSLLVSVRTAGAGAFTGFFDPNPAAGNQFGSLVVPLSTGNVVITSPGDDAGASDAGAVYLFNGATGVVISMLRGSTANDRIGDGNRGVVALTNGNFVVVSSDWDNAGVVDAGAATWGSGTAGVSGTISAANSLVGAIASDRVGNDEVRALTNGNYVVGTSSWDNAGIVNAGAATWGNGATGLTGTISAANSLVGSKAFDLVGVFHTALSNGNYLVTSPAWDNGAVLNAGAATWGNGATGTTGAVSAANSLIGASNNEVGGGTALALSNGNYVVLSENWDNGGSFNVGAATWGNGTTGTVGLVTAGNSIIGSTLADGDDMLGIALTNGNYVIRRPRWNNGANVDAGAATWGNGTTGTSGVVSAANSLVGSSTDDAVSGAGVFPLTNGNYVVRSPDWNNGATTDAGAATWGNGTTGVSGVISAANSLIGGAASDLVGGGGVTALTNGNYVVGSGSWDNGATPDVGAATWGNGTTGTTGLVTPANSLIGTSPFDYVGEYPSIALTNGNYVVRSSQWDNGVEPDVGAATWCIGTAATSGIVSAANSLVGSANSDRIGSGGVALANGNYVMLSPDWDGAITNAGAATWCNGTGTTSAVVSAANSLVGVTNDDNVGAASLALSDGNYVILSSQWDNTLAFLTDSGAATWGNGTTGTAGAVGPDNSLLGNADFTAAFRAYEEPVNDYFIVPYNEEGGKVRVGREIDRTGVDGWRNRTGIRLLSPVPNPSSGGARIAAVFPARDRISVELVDVRGRAVRMLAKDEPVDAGEWSVVWDGRNQAGQRVPAGVYFVRLKTQADEVTGRLGVVR